MNKEVFVTLKGLQFNEQLESDKIEVVTLGEYYDKNNKKYIIFEEVVEGVEDKIKTMIKLSPTVMEVTKKGLTSAHMVFEVDKKNYTVYRTMFGEIQIGIQTKSIEIDEAEDEMTVKVDYELEMNCEHVASCSINLNVSSKSEGKISLRE